MLLSNSRKLLSVAATAIAATLTLQASEELSFKDYIVEKDIYKIVAESQNETAISPNSSFFPKRRVSTLVDYCESIGGIPEYNKDNELDTSKPINCSAPNGKGFVATFNHIPRGNNGQYSVVIIKHEKPQLQGYAMKTYINENDIAKKGLKDFNSAMLDFGSEFYNYYGACVSKGGQYLISNTETDNKVVDGTEYLIQGSMHGKSTYSYGVHWCVNTPSKNDEFTVNVTRHPFNGVTRFQPKYGIENMKEKYSNPLPWYSTHFEAKQPVAKVEDTSQGGGQIEKRDYRTGKVEIINSKSIVNNANTQSVAISRMPTSVETALAQKVIQTKSTQLGRGNGYMVEGLYLGTSTSGRDLAAVVKTADTPINSKSIYGKNWNPQWVMNFTDTSNGQRPALYTGESFEKSFPLSISNEYKRVLDMCNIKGISGSSYLGYDISCERQGSMAQPIYEMTILKKDQLVLRDYEK